MRFWMPPFTTGKEKEILDGLLSITDNVHKSVVSLDRAVNAFVKEEWQSVDKEVDTCSKFEQKADDNRRMLQRLLYAEGFLPFSREDYFNLAESLDNIADQAEKASFWISFKKIKVPKNIGVMLVELSEKSLDTVEKLKEILDNLGPKSKDIINATQAVESQREIVREMTTKMGKEIFRKEETDSFMLWELVYRIMSVADRAEETADRIITISMKLVE